MSSNPVTALLPPAHPGEALTTDPADAGQHPEHPLPPTRASLQQRVTTPGMPRTDSTRRTPSTGGWLAGRPAVLGPPDLPLMCVRRGALHQPHMAWATLVVLGSRCRTGT